MVLTKEISDKIIEAWQYGAASSCRFAISQLDKFANRLLLGQSVTIEEGNLIIQNLSEFLIWKNKNWIFKQIKICNNLSQSGKIDLINKLVTDYNINKIQFVETDRNNHYFDLILKSEKGEFQLSFKVISDLDIIPTISTKINYLIFLNNNNNIDIVINKETRYMIEFKGLEIR